MKNLYADLAALLTAGEDVAVATIAGRSGSAPRTAGARMLVRRDGSFTGTIGGGLVEKQVLESAREVLATGRSVFRHFSLTGTDVESMDMICGGNLDVLVELWSARSATDLAVCRLAAECLRRRERGWLATRLPGSGEGIKGSLPRWFLGAGGRQAGPDPPESLRVEMMGRRHRNPGPVLVELDGQRFLLEAVSTPATVYIFGAGHVSQQLAELTVLVGFRTVVLDDRAEFVTRERFPRADELILLSGFAGCLAGLELSSDSYLVIVTRGHRHDLTVLEQALSTDAGYIGMIGSRNKIETLYRALREKGVSPEQLARVHAPIGLAIGAETPEEIAVSIVAELIRVRAHQGPQGE